MKLESQCCTQEQAKQLKDLGIAQESFLYWYRSDCLDDDIPYHVAQMLFGTDENFSAFTAAELGVMLPDWCPCYRTHPGQFKKLWICEGTEGHERQGDTQAEAIANMLIYLLESKLITPESVNQRLAEA